MTGGGSSVDVVPEVSRKRTQTGSREVGGSESVRHTRQESSIGGRANWRTLFERGASKAPKPAASVLGKENISSPRPLSPVTQWGWVEQGALVGVL